MTTETVQKSDKSRADRLLKRRQVLLEAVRKDIQALQKIVNPQSQKQNKPTS